MKNKRKRFEFASPISKKVSIIIPNLNGQKYLGECIDSLLSLDFPRASYEILVVDNASSDDSKEFIRSYYPDVTLIEATCNLGFAGGCNLGMRYSQGEYLVLLNNDTTTDKNWLKELVAVADSDTDIGIVGSKLFFKHKPNIIQNAGSYLTSRGDGGDIGFHDVDEGQYDTAKEVFAACGASMLIKRTLVEQIGGLDEDFFAYYEDTDLCYRARLFGRKVVFNPRSIVYHVHAATLGEWTPFFTFLASRNKLLMHLKNSSLQFLVKVLFLYCCQAFIEGVVKGNNRKIHFRILASLVKKFPKFLLKRLKVRFILKRVTDSKVLLRLSRVKPRQSSSLVEKVCIYNAFLPTMGGGENQMARTIEYINEIFPSASVDILCHETATFGSSSFAGKDFIKMLQDNFHVSLENTRVRLAGVEASPKSTMGFVRRIEKLASISKEYDLFVNNTAESVLPARAKFNIYYCMFPKKFVFSDNLLLWLPYRWWWYRFLKSYDIFLANSQHTQHWIDNYWGVNSNVLYPPIQQIKASVNENKDNIVISVGRFFVGGHSKRRDIMIRTFIKMLEEGQARDWKLVLVGRKHVDKKSAKYIEFLEKMAEGYPIEFMYDIDDDKLMDLLDRSKIYWHAAGYGRDPNVHPERFEHFGMSTIEAMRLGAVPVVLNGGGQSEIVSNGKNGFLWNTIDELIKYTKLLLDDEPLRKKLSLETFNSSKTYQVDKQLIKLKILLSPFYQLTEEIE